jgi:hypothetical protein
LDPPIGIARNLGIIVVTTLVGLVIFDLIGVAMSFYFDTFSSRSTSTALFYAIWFVLGVFCGLLIYNAGGSFVSPESKGDWTDREDAGKTGLVVILTATIVLAALSYSFYHFQWGRYNMAPSVFVPDSEPLTLTFFVTILASMILAHLALRPEPKKKASRKR